MSTENREKIHFCPCHVTCTSSSCPLDYEKIEYFKNIGLVIYNRISGVQDEKAPPVTVDNAPRSIIVQNTGDQAITSADLSQEIEKRGPAMSCPKCREIVGLVNNLLQRLPSLDKNVSMGICYKCKFKDPCLECKDNTTKFFQNYEAEKVNYKAQIRDWEIKMKKMAEENFLDWFNKRPPRDELRKMREESRKIKDELQRSKYEAQKRGDDVKIIKDQLLHRDRIRVDKHKDVPEIGRPYHSQTHLRKMKRPSKLIQEPSITDDFKIDTELRMDHLLRREHDRAARNLDISDLIQSPPTPRSKRVLPYIISPKSSTTSKDSESRAFGKSHAGSMRTAKQKLQFEKNHVPARKDVSNTSITTFEKISTETWTKVLKQSKRYEDDRFLSKSDDVYSKRKDMLPKYKDTGLKRKGRLTRGEDIFPENREPPRYAHDQEKYADYIDEQEDVEDIYDRDIRKSSRKQRLKKRIKTTTDKQNELSDEQLLSDISVDNLSKQKGVISILRPKEPKKKSLKFPKVGEAETEKEPERDFSFSFPTRPLKPRKVFTRKSSAELIKDTHEMLQARTDELIRKIEEKRLQSAEKKEAKRLVQEEKSRLLEEKRQEAEENKLAESERKLMDRIERKLEKEFNVDKEQETGTSVEEAHEMKEPTDEAQDSHTSGSKSKPTSGSSKKKTPSQTSVDRRSVKSGIDTQKKAGDTKDVSGKSQKEETKEATGVPKDETKAFTGKPRYATKELTDKNATKEATEKEGTKDFTGKFTTNAKGPEAKVKISSDKEKSRKSTPESSEKKGFKLAKKPVDAKPSEEEKEEKSETKTKKETWTIKMSKEKGKSVSVKIGKGTVPSKPKELLDKGLADILKGKNVFKPREIGQLARLKDRVATPPEKPPKEKKAKEIQKFKLRRPSTEKKPLLVKFKRSLNAPGYKYKGKSIRVLFNIHETKHKVIKDPMCPFCLSSDLVLEFEFRNPTKYQQEEQATEIIRGMRIIDGSFANADKKAEKKPELFQVMYEVPAVSFADSKGKKKDDKGTSPVKGEPPKPVDTSGVTRFYLSDRSFIDKGWTMLPTEKVMRRMNVYRMRPAKPEFDWFKRNKKRRKMFYETGEPLAQLDENDTCRWFYKNGRVALDYYNAEEQNAQQRFIIYSNGEPDEGGRPRPYTQLAMFDYLGNGIVFDHGGKVRLKYNQTEGVVLDKKIGPESHWKWHTLNDPPELHQVMIDTQLAHKDPYILSIDHDETNHQPRVANEDMLAIEFDNFIKEKSKKLTQKFKPFQIRMKAMKINEHFSLKILDQASVYLIYRDGTTNIKLNIGMILDHKEIVDTDTAEVGNVSSNVERFPAKTESLEKIQKGVARSKCIEKWRSNRELWLKPPEPSASVDQLKAAVARPLRPPLRAVNSNSVSSSSINTPKNKNTDQKDECDCGITKQKSFNL